uniref:Uncharacterized protein n=1 Tax=Neisseria meningitidis alpha275 TaxID=295996 RepID=C6SIA3_NEIME|nr:hypothetical protein predicted by Glimmer/Critica [Neisseria meningitidis alpha275]
MGDVGVFFAVAKQDERFIFVAGCFIFEQGQPAQVAAFFINDGLNRVRSLR